MDDSGVQWGGPERGDVPDGEGLVDTGLPARISEAGSKDVVSCFPESRSDDALVWRRDRNQSRRKQCREDASRRNQLLQTGNAVVA